MPDPVPPFSPAHMSLIRPAVPGCSDEGRWFDVAAPTLRSWSRAEYVREVDRDEAFAYAVSRLLDKVRAGVFENAPSQSERARARTVFRNLLRDWGRRQSARSRPVPTEDRCRLPSDEVRQRRERRSAYAMQALAEWSVHGSADWEAKLISQMDRASLVPEGSPAEAALELPGPAVGKLAVLLRADPVRVGRAIVEAAVIQSVPARRWGVLRGTDETWRLLQPILAARAAADVPGASPTPEHWRQIAVVLRTTADPRGVSQSDIDAAVAWLDTQASRGRKRLANAVHRNKSIGRSDAA